MIPSNLRTPLIKNLGRGYSLASKPTRFAYRDRVSLPIQPNEPPKTNRNWGFVELPLAVAESLGFSSISGFSLWVWRGQGVPEVDQVAIETQELSTTLRIPMGQPVLVGGMTFRWPDDEKPVDAKAEAKENAQMYLVLEIR